jgi:2-C-methyl-D-erythritol 2,4-cyclodiphosphate synthase
MMHGERLMDFSSLRVGIGYDVHPFSEGCDLIIGGERLPFHAGLAGHSDADVLVHAIIDSLLGAAALGDIGKLFPARDEKYRGISSLELLREVGDRFSETGIAIINIDSIVICEEPKIAPHVNRMRGNISAALGDLDRERISIKATTTEQLGFVGRGEGIAAQAISLIQLP